MNAQAPKFESDALARFHAGERASLEECYRAHFSKVLGAAARILGNVDAETVTHDVFCRVLSEAAFRESYRGGNLGAWLARVATNAAIDCLRRRSREVPSNVEHRDLEADPSRVDDEVEAKLLVERFRRERLPEKWQALFDARFLRQLPQRDAARELGIQRSTLVYQEQRIRELLEDFLLGSEAT